MISFACIAPHGAEIVEDLSRPQPDLMVRTRRAMEELGRRAERAKLDALIVLTPHGVRVEGQFSVTDSERVSGEVESHGAVRRLTRGVDRALARSVATEAEADGLAVARLGFATSEGPFSTLPLDWGALIPLCFLPEVEVVVINPPRGADFEPHRRFGAALARATGNRRVGLVASCDWSHTHDASGPYGFHEAAARLDARVVDLVRGGDLEGLASFEPAFVEDAKPDGPWQAVVLVGAVPAPRRAEVLSYEAPTYFGLLCAEVSGITGA